MGNQQSGGGGLDDTIGNRLAAISEHTFDWTAMDDDDDDSIWDEASLADDVHSLGESSRRGDGPTTFELLPSVIRTTQKIEKAKYRLLKARSKTIEKREEMKREKKNYRSELKKTEKLLKKVARKAPSYFGYFDYFNMVKRSYNTKGEKSDLNTEYYTNRKATSSPSKKSNKPMSTAIVTQGNSFFFSIFALWEAYLLKKAHIAAMQNTQAKKQKKGWNDVIVNLQHERQGMDDAFAEKAKAMREKIKTKEAELSQIQDAYLNLVRCQDKLIRKLQEHENWMSGSIMHALVEGDSSESEEGGIMHVLVEGNSSDSEEGREYELPYRISTLQDNTIPTEINTSAYEEHEGTSVVTDDDISIEIAVEQEKSEQGTLDDAEDDVSIENAAEQEKSEKVGNGADPEKEKDSQFSPVQLRDQNLKKKLKEAKELMNSSMKDLTLEEDDYW
ncbi:unnamed protein product [Cylindrotheca closterium]|uniref:Uncharacterized protein n=1 Tax=Cylindrotheca closterium TaxID=2856 RepID=A0AAD2G6I1_9STRA|nr:unnamed protein product [Cylindrotheca closterium]